MTRTTVQRDLYLTKIQQNTPTLKKDALGYKKLSGQSVEIKQRIYVIKQERKVVTCETVQRSASRDNVNRSSFTKGKEISKQDALLQTPKMYTRRRSDRNKQERPVVEIENLGVKKLSNLNLKDMISARFIPENTKVNLGEVSDKWLDTPNKRIGGTIQRFGSRDNSNRSSFTKGKEISKQDALLQIPKMYTRRRSDRNKLEPPVVEIENLGVKKLLNLNLKEKYDEIISVRFIPENRKVNLNEISDKWLDTPNERIGGIVPRSFLGTEKEWVIVDLIQNIEQGYPI